MIFDHQGPRYLRFSDFDRPKLSFKLLWPPYSRPAQSFFPPPWEEFILPGPGGSFAPIESSIGRLLVLGVTNFHLLFSSKSWITVFSSKYLSKVAHFWLILFRIFHWSFLWSPFWSIWSHLRIFWQKLPITSIFNPFFLETWTFLGRTVTCVEFVSKNSLKWAKVVFFEKMTEWTLI